MRPCMNDWYPEVAQHSRIDQRCILDSRLTTRSTFLVPHPPHWFADSGCAVGHQRRCRSLEGAQICADFKRIALTMGPVATISEHLRFPRPGVIKQDAATEVHPGH